MSDRDRNTAGGRLEDTADFAAVGQRPKGRRGGAHAKSGGAHASRGGQHSAQRAYNVADSGRRAEPAREKKRASGLKKALIAILIVVALLLGGTAGFAVYVSRTDTIFPNVTLDGVELGGLTVSEAADRLTAAGWVKEDESVSVPLPAEHTLTITAAEAGASVTAEEAAQAAYDYCHEGNLLSGLMRYVNCVFSGGSVETVIDVDRAAVQSAVEAAVADTLNDLEASGVEVDEDRGVISVVKGAADLDIDTAELTRLFCEAFAARRYGTLDYAVDEEGAAQLDVDALYESLHREAQDAAYDPETGEVSESVTGLDFDKNEALSLWDAAQLGEVVEIPCTVTEPEHTTEEVEGMLFRDELATVVTYLYGSTQNRIDNVALAAQSINGIVLAPGQQFDYNEALGERTTERGYKAAGAYSGGQVVQEVGGGICQVSSMVYYAALLSNLQIDTRTCHYFPVSYVNPGMDATVSWGGPEFRFTNDRDWPIRIEASVNQSDKSVTVSFYGTDVDGSYVEMTYSTWSVYNNAQYPETATGYRAATYRNVYSADGELISRDLEAYSEYHYHEEDIVYPTPTPRPPRSRRPRRLPATRAMSLKIPRRSPPTTRAMFSWTERTSRHSHPARHAARGDLFCARAGGAARNKPAKTRDVSIKRILTAQYLKI